MIGAIRERADHAIRERVFPGCAIAVLHAGRIEYVYAGRLTYEREASPVDVETVYDLASVTKSIPTASLALNLLRSGIFELSDLVSRYIPELKNDFNATIEDLLRYSVRGPRMSELSHMSAADVARAIFAHGFASPPGGHQYANVPAFLLGIVLERLTADSLAGLSERHFFIPLNMRHTTFFPRATLCAPTEVVNGKEVRGIVHDESARVFAREGRAVGHAGLFSTSEGMGIFMQALLDQKYPHVVEGAKRGLGWQVASPYFMGSHASEHAFGKTGFTGSSVLIDTEKDAAIAILSNRTYPLRPADAVDHGSAINVFRRDIANIVLSEVH